MLSQNQYNHDNSSIRQRLNDLVRAIPEESLEIIEKILQSYVLENEKKAADLVGKYSHSLFRSDDFIKEKHMDNEREEQINLEHFEK